jgi:hypothetical protein
MFGNLPMQFIYLFNYFPLLCSPAHTMASSFTRFLDHTRHTTVGRTPPDEWSAHRRDIYLTTCHTHNRQNIHASGRIWAHDRSRWAVVDLCLRPCGHWDWLTYAVYILKIRNKCQLVGQSVSWSVGQSVGKPVNHSVGQSAGWSVCRLGSQPVGRSAGWAVGRLGGRLVGQSASWAAASCSINHRTLYTITAQTLAMFHVTTIWWINYCQRFSQSHVPRVSFMFHTSMTGTIGPVFIGHKMG